MPPPNSLRTAAGAPGPDYWQQRADHAIEATLDAAAKRLTASQSITYTNNSPDELAFVWLSLEQNLFRPGSDGANMTRPSARFGHEGEFRGGYENLSVRVNGVETALAVYDTIARLNLPAPVAARGGQVRIDMSWTFAVPAYGSDRMGIDEVAAGPIFQMAQWFPSVCVYDDVHGWNTLPYLGQGEFYTNFGDYQVSLTVPADHIVAATGELENSDEVLPALSRERLSRARTSREPVIVFDPAEMQAGGSPRPGSQTWRFVARDVRTFAWASSPAFIWDACGASGSGPGSAGDPSRGSGVLCQSFYPREAADLWGPAHSVGGSTRMVRDSVEHYSRKWYAYPYPTATNVNGVVGGMEYPMIVFCGGRDSTVTGARGLWYVTTHEIGHTWFPMIVNSDERRHAWMDEGFDTFINFYATLERDPDELPRRGHPRRWARDHRNPTSQPIDIPADEVEPGTLGDQQYDKAATGLVLLREGILGPERFDAAFREYIRRWAFKSPRPADFFRTMEDVSGAELGWFFRGWFYERGVMDQGIRTVMQPGGNADDDAGSDARMTLENRGELVMPVVFRVTYADGTEETRRLPVNIWATGGTWQTQWDTGGRRIKSVELDPNQDFPDVNPGNDRWP